MRFYLGLLLVFLMLPVSAATLQLYTEEFFPYNYTENQQHRGINTDLLKLACQKISIECSFTTLPWLRAYELVKHRPNTGLYSTVRTQGRESSFLWVGPLASSTTYLYRLKSRTDIAAKDLEQTKAFGIAVAHGDFFEERLLQHGFILGKNLLRVKRKTDAVPLFLSGKIDLLIASEQVLPGWLAPHGKTRSDVEPVLDISFMGQNYLALNLQTNPKLVQRLQDALQQLASDNELNRLKQHYHSLAMPHSVGK